MMWPVGCWLVGTPGEAAAKAARKPEGPDAAAWRRGLRPRQGERARRRSTSGEALVEFALILPVFLLLLLGVIEFGRLLQSWVTIQHAVEEAARYAATGQRHAEGAGVREAQIAAVARAAIVGLLVDDAAGPAAPAYVEVVIRSSRSGPDPLEADDAGGPDDFARVEVLYNHPFVVPYVRPGYLPLRSTALVRNEHFGRPLVTVAPLPSTPVATWTPTSTPTPTWTPSPTATPTPTDVPPALTSTLTPSASPTVPPTATTAPPTSTPTPTATPTASPTPTATPCAAPRITGDLVLAPTAARSGSPALDAVRVSWTTDLPADSRLEWRRPGAPARSASNATLATEHSLATDYLLAGVPYQLLATSSNACGSDSKEATYSR